MESDLVKKIGLGSVQFGLPYGINNSSGQVMPNQVAHILSYGDSIGIEVIDTASAYGRSEEVLGNILARQSHSFKIISKIAPNTSNIRSALQASLQKLQIPRLYGFMFHRIEDVQTNPSLEGELRVLKKEGHVEKIGFSLYYPDDIKYLLDHNISFDLIQVPYSVLDRRFETWFPQLRALGVEVHIRSVFLQGLFFRGEEHLPSLFDTIRPILQRIRQNCQTYQVPLTQALLFFALMNKDIDRVIVGVDSLDNLKENTHFLKLNQVPSVSLINQIFEGIACEDEQILLPFNWKL